CQQWSSYPRTF
nr:immunoglobulin light chain junction region [Mus musculus]NSL99257.1 immunoglobulin light chain junction region [Mus musculus]NSM00797.1 immunoglobulin light chain junction region [Mus musculus]NSM01326.1 immunoglobulin light chain junction region [Mus musculus]